MIKESVEGIMNFEKWIDGFKTIYEGIWVGINKDVKKFGEDDNTYSAELNSGQLYFINKKDVLKIEEFIKDKNIDLLFGVEKQTGTCTELLMEFNYDDQKYRILTSYGLEGEEKITLYAWGSEETLYAIELATKVCDILLSRDGIKDKYQKGILSLEYDGIINESNSTL